MTTTAIRHVLRDLARTLGGHTFGEVLIVDGHKVYCAFNGKLRLERTGYPVTDLGGCSDDPETLAAAYRAVVS